MKQASFIAFLVLQVPLAAGFVVPPAAVVPATSTSLGASAKFEELKKEFPEDVDVVKAGGWHNLEKLSEDPKGELVRTIMKGLKGAKGNVENEMTSEKLEALVTLLQCKNRGFGADLVDGDWAIVFIRQGNKSPSFQKAVGKKERAGLSMNTFDIKEMTFTGEVKLLKKGVISTKVKYDPVTDGFDVTSKGKIVLRRIMCDIVQAGFKFWRLPRLSLPFLKRKGGFLDFVYMDEEIRITTGSRGGLFVHFRPDFLEKQLEASSEEEIIPVPETATTPVSNVESEIAPREAVLAS